MTTDNGDDNNNNVDDNHHHSMCIEYISQITTTSVFYQSFIGIFIKIINRGRCVSGDSANSPCVLGSQPDDSDQG